MEEHTMRAKVTAKMAIGGSVLVCGTLCGLAVHADPPITDKIPTMTSGVQNSNQWCTYTNAPPFVTQIKWDDPLIKAMEPAFGTWDASGTETAPGIGRSTMSYGDHMKMYGLDEANDWNAQKGLYMYWMNKTGITDAARTHALAGIDKKCARANYENFVKTVLGEYRDYPFMIKTKFTIVASHTPVNKKGPQVRPADQAFLFDGMTGDGYSRLRWIMDAVFEARQAQLNPTHSGMNYSWGEVGHGSNRVDNSSKPITHAEMRYIFAEWLQGPSKPFNLAQYEQGLARFIQQNCNASPTGPDLGYMYDFRGDKNFKANWMECNAFIWNSRHYCRKYEAQVAKHQTPDSSYFQRPFATRVQRSKEALAAYLFYPSAQHADMRKASESGGGPHMYIDNEDANGDGVADYRLFPDVMGSGDIGLESQALPSERVNAQPVTRDTVSTFRKANMSTVDWGFGATFTVSPATRPAFTVDHVFTAQDSDAQATFKLRMARINVALDRHTNWGPTMMFSPTMFTLSKRYAIRGAYSPIVAMSYEISKSHNFAVGDFPGGHPADQGKTKWMYFVKFPTANYYDERALRAGATINWAKMYLNEGSLSNDYYQERALDKFGCIPAADMHTACYLSEADGEDSYYPGASTTGPNTGLIDSVPNH